jgi:hypothetical protein
MNDESEDKTENNNDERSFEDLENSNTLSSKDTSS